MIPVNLYVRLTLFIQLWKWNLPDKSGSMLGQSEGHSNTTLFEAKTFFKGRKLGIHIRSVQSKEEGKRSACKLNTFLF